MEVDLSKDENDKLPVNRSYLLAARQLLEFQKNYYGQFMSGAHEYGKWLIAQLFLIHAGGFTAIFSARGSPENLDHLFPYFAFGLGFALATGFFAWINFSVLGSDAQEWLSPHILQDPKEWKRIYGEKIGSARDPIGATYWLAIACGFMSFIFAITAAVEYA